MRTILLLLICVVGFVLNLLMLASLQADAKRFVSHERHLAQVKNDPNLGAEHICNSESQSAPTTNQGSSDARDSNSDDNRYYVGPKGDYRPHKVSKPAY